jgi:hypothetical protein
MPTNGDFAFDVRVAGGHVQLEEYHDVRSVQLQVSSLLYCRARMLIHHYVVQIS